MAPTDRYTIISSDCHAGANHATYREYLAAEWQDEFDAWRGKYKNPFRDLQDDGRSRNWDDDDFPKRLAGLHAHNYGRFPNLKLVMTEQGSQWVPNVLKRMDALWERMSGGRIGELDVPDGAVTKKKASEYWQQNCYLGASFPGPDDADVFAEIGLDRVMWGSDYPHNEGTYPKTRESLRAAFSGWKEPELKMAFSENIAKVYGFDLDALGPIAAEVGPTVEEIATPIS